MLGTSRKWNELNWVSIVRNKIEQQDEKTHNSMPKYIRRTQIFVQFLLQSFSKGLSRHKLYDIYDLMLLRSDLSETAILVGSIPLVDVYIGHIYQLFPRHYNPNSWDNLVRRSSISKYLPKSNSRALHCTENGRFDWGKEMKTDCRTEGTRCRRPTTSSLIRRAHWLSHIRLETRNQHAADKRRSRWWLEAIVSDWMKGPWNEDLNLELIN